MNYEEQVRTQLQNAFDAKSYEERLKFLKEARKTLKEVCKRPGDKGGVSMGKIDGAIYWSSQETSCKAYIQEALDKLDL